jgi:hypothetical protein
MKQELQYFNEMMMMSILNMNNMAYSIFVKNHWNKRRILSLNQIVFALTP